MNNLNHFICNIKNNYNNNKDETINRYVDQYMLTEYLFHVCGYSPKEVVLMLQETAYDFQQFIGV